MSKIVKIVFDDNSEIKYIEQPVEFFETYTHPEYLFRNQHRNWLEDIVLPRFPYDLEDWAKDKYDLINEDDKNSIEDFSDWEIEREFMKRDIRLNLIPNESIINQDFVQRIIEITKRGNAIEIDKTLETLEKAYLIK